MLKKYQGVTLILGMILLLLTLIPSTTVNSAEKVHIASESTDASSIDFIYFYVNICESCTEAKEQINLFIDQIDQADLDVQINFTAYNISYYDGFEYDLYLSFGLNTSVISISILLYPQKFRSIR